jgi:hypothetical protein
MKIPQKSQLNLTVKTVTIILAVRKTMLNICAQQNIIG